MAGGGYLNSDHSQHPSAQITAGVSSDHALFPYQNNSGPNLLQNSGWAQHNPWLSQHANHRPTTPREPVDYSGPNLPASHGLSLPGPVHPPPLPLHPPLPGLLLPGPVHPPPLPIHPPLPGLLLPGPVRPPPLPLHPPLPKTAGAMHFVLQWPPAFGCQRTDLTIHGLWLILLGINPTWAPWEFIVEDCLKKQDQDELHKWFPDVLCKSAEIKVQEIVNEGLWTHEWVDHGVITGVNPYTYFRGQLLLRRLFEESGISELLREFRFRRIQVGELISRIYDRCGLLVRIQGRRGNLMQIYVCVSSSWGFMSYPEWFQLGLHPSDSVYIP